MQKTVSTNCKKKVLIIGGGPAGLTAAYLLSKAGIYSIVIEKDNMVGGISKTVNYKNFLFDIGGHRFFTKNKEVEDIWNDVLGKDLLRCKRLSRIYFNNNFFYYPFKVMNALLGLGIWNCFLIVLSYLHVKLTPFKKNETFEQWVTNRFGKHLFNLFFKGYTEKVWGISCSEIRAEWAAQRIKGLSLISALKNALSIQKNGGKKKKSVIKTLINEFDYPKYGPGMMWNAVASKIKENGSKVLLGSEVVGILWSEGCIKGLEIKRNGTINTLYGTDIISSMPIKEAINKIKPNAPLDVTNAANNLKYRDFITVALIIDKRDIFPDNWIYIHDPDVKVGRIQNFKNWSPYMVPDPEKTCLGLEYFCFEGDLLWNMPDSDLIALGKRELEVIGFATQDEIKDGAVVRMPKAYPVYDGYYKKSLDFIRKFVDKINNLYFIGRNGQHKYNNQDHSMLTAMQAVKNVQGANHNLWQVNEESEYHEEVILEAIKRTFARIDKLGFATALGSIFGAIIFIATIFLIIKGGENVGTNLQLLSQFFIGYTVTVQGAFIGMTQGFLWAFLLGWFIAYVRNFLVAFYIYRLKKRKEFLSFSDFIDHY